MKLAGGDVKEAVSEYLDHARVAELLNGERASNRDAVHKEIALLVEQAVGIYEDYCESLPDLDAEVAERSDIAHDKRVDDHMEAA